MWFTGFSPPTGVSPILWGEQFYAFDKDEGSILVDRKIDHQRPDNYRANLQTQTGQAIRLLAGLVRIKFQAADDLTQGPGYGLAAALAPGLTVDPADGSGDDARTMDFKTARTITGAGHSTLSFCASGFSPDRRPPAPQEPGPRGCLPRSRCISASPPR